MEVTHYFCCIQVMLAGPIGNAQRKLLHPLIITPTYTPESHDEVHLILEYPKGATWGEITSSCANRVIISHDVSNARMVALEGFQEYLHDFKPDLVVLSGAHLMQAEEREFRMRRLAEVSEVLGAIPSSIPVHGELATVGDLTYLQELGEAMFPQIDSLGLNEQELVSMAKSFNADFDFTRIPAKPSVPVASDLLHWLIEKFSSLTRKSSRLTRVHFHTLSFHIIAVLQQPSRWENSESAVLAATRVAGLQACDLDQFDIDQFELRQPLNFTLSSRDQELSQSIRHITTQRPVATWQRQGVQYYMSPVLVCKKPLKTVGLGDTISSFGLLYSEFSHNSFV